MAHVCWPIQNAADGKAQPRSGPKLRFQEQSRITLPSLWLSCADGQSSEAWSEKMTGYGFGVRRTDVGLGKADSVISTQSALAGNVRIISKW